MYRRLEKAVKEECSMTDAEISIFARVGAIFGYNAFAGGKPGTQCVFETITLMSHSCRCNCTNHVNAEAHGVVRCIRPIAAGEELTITYCSRRDAYPTHLRRSQTRGGVEVTAAVRAVYVWGRLFDNMALTSTNDEVSDGFYHIGDKINLFHENYHQCFQVGVAYIQKAIRLNLIRGDRTAGAERVPKYDERLCQLMNKIEGAPKTSLTECALCGETPEYAAIRLLKCGKCKEVVYCGAGCQKVHWPVHKKGCKKK
eukprot:gene37254-45971_t